MCVLDCPNHGELTADILITLVCSSVSLNTEWAIGESPDRMVLIIAKKII